MIVLRNILTCAGGDNEYVAIKLVSEKRYRSSDHVYDLKTLIDLYAENDKKVYTCFVDFQKDCGTIWLVGRK